MKKYIIAFSLFCLSLFLIDEVYAATGTYESSTYSYTNCNGMSCSTSWQAYKSMGEISNPTNKQIGSISFRAYAPSTNTWATGNNYSFRYRVCESAKWTNSESLSRLRDKAFLYEYSYSSTNSASNPTIGDVSDVTMTITDDTASNYCWFISFNFTPKITSRFVGFKVELSSISEYNYLAGIYTGNDFRTNGLSITYQEGVGAIFQEQTDKLVNEQQQTNDKLDNLNDSLTSEDAPNLDSLENSSGWLPPGPIDSILNLPLSLLNNLNTNLSKKCQPVEVNLPYVNRTISLPCLNTIYSQMGNLSSWINGIGIIAAAFILFRYFINLYKWVDDTLTFRENNWLDNWGGL